ncbi:MAG: metal-dependent transcriptional regulator [Armatimonadetes bacterium]|nr:metal-dependent transcriptional regulator [Armatimonadota bacterium]
MTSASAMSVVDPDAGLSESLEDYLEAILAIEDEKHAARSKDIVRRLSVSPPSVTAALQNLAARGLVNYAPYDLITLTEQGRRIAADVRRRHEALRRFFTELLKVDPDEADQIACHMEHSLPSHVLTRLVDFMDFIGECPWGELSWSPAGGFERRWATPPARTDQPE